MKNMIIAISIMELLFLGISFLATYPIGIADREEPFLKGARKVIFITVFVSLNLVTFLG